MADVRIVTRSWTGTGSRFDGDIGLSRRRIKRGVYPPTCGCQGESDTLHRTRSRDQVLQFGLGGWSRAAAESGRQCMNARPDPRSTRSFFPRVIIR